MTSVCSTRYVPCQAALALIETEADEFCADGYPDDFGHGDTEPAVLYFIPKEAVPTGPSFATDTGFKPNYRFQTLYEKEKSYSGSVFDPHDYLPYKFGNFLDWQVYNDGTVSNHREAWIVGNASASNSNITSSALVDEDNVDYKSSDVFSGGFAGKCAKKSSWFYNSSSGIWECSDYIKDKEVTINTNFYQVPPNGTYTPDTIYAGFQINASEIQKYNTVYENAPIKGDTADSTIDYTVNQLRMQVQCAQGDPYGDAIDQLPSKEQPDGEDYVNASIPVNPSETTQVIMKSPVWDSNSGEYNCFYGFQQYVQGVHPSAGSPVDEAPIPEKTYQTWQKRGNFNYGNWPSYYDVTENGAYIIEGVNNHGSIESYQETGVILNPTSLEYRSSNFGDIRDELADMEIQNSYYTSGDPFTNFPEPSIEPGGSDVKRRKPIP